MFGYDLNDVPNGKQWFKLAYPDRNYRREVISAWIEKVESVKPGGEIIPVTFTVRCKDGTEKIMHFRMVLLYTSDYFNPLQFRIYCSSLPNPPGQCPKSIGDLLFHIMQYFLKTSPGRIAEGQRCG